MRRKSERMPQRQREKRELKPKEADPTVAGLLSLERAWMLPLESGSRWDGYGTTGDFILAAAVQGSLTIAAHGQYALLDPGQAYVLESPGDYAVQAASRGQCMAVLLRGELAPRLLERRGLFPGGAAAVREAVLSLAVLEQEQGQAPGTAASALAYRLLLRLRDLPPSQDLSSPLVEAALAIIQEEFPFLEGVEELAERLKVSSAHLGRVFTRKTGVPPGKYITRVRIEYAKLLLQDPGATVTYAAEASGFANANYFAKVFRRETGLSPTEYLAAAPKRQPGRAMPHFDI